MPELAELLQREALRLHPDRVPPFDAVVRKERRRRRVSAAVVLAGLAAAVGAATMVGRTLVPSAHRETLLPGGGVSPVPTPPPDVLIVDCTVDGTSLPQGDRVTAQRDGVHYLFRNQTPADVGITYELAGDQLAAQQSKAVVSSRVAPGQATTVSCGSNGAALKSNARSIAVEDPDGVYVAVPACRGPSVVRDYVAPFTGEPVPLTRKNYDRAEPVGYPDGSPRLVYTGDSLISWEGAGEAWTPSTTTQCSTTAGGMADPPLNALRWRYTGSLPMEGKSTLDALAYTAFAKAQGRTPAEFGAGGAIWAGTLPDGQRLVIVQVWALGTTVMHTVAYADGGGRSGRIVQDLTLTADTKEFTVLVPGPQPWAVTLRPAGAEIRLA